MTVQNNPASSTADRELIASRLLDAPRERVFAAWADPEQLARWWGPKGFTNTFESFDFRPGGLWKFIMHGPDGTNYPNEIRFTEIEPPSRIVLEHTSGPCFQVTATFEAQGGKTLVTFHQLFKSKEDCDKVRHFAEPANSENLERLAAVVAEQA